MAHPYQKHREHHKERERVHHITGTHEGHRDYEHTYHRARGGHVTHKDEAEDKAVVKSMVKHDALKKSHHRADKRARGGKVKHKGKTVVNVNVAPQQSAPHPMPVPMPAPGAGAAPSAPPPRPPMPAPAPPGAMPPMGPRAFGGRTGFATGGSVKRANGGQTLQPNSISKDRSLSGRSVSPPIGSVPVTGTGTVVQNPQRATGGPVEPHFKQGVGMGPKAAGSAKGAKITSAKVKDFSEHGPMAPHGGSGVGGGVSRVQMKNRAAKVYHKTPPAVHTPGMKST